MEGKSMKVKRNQRLIYLTNYFVEHPNQLISLSYFADLFDIAKSSLSEDIQFIKEIFQQYDLGVVETIAGVSGGVIYSPQVSKAERQALINEMTELMTDIHRILPGNYIQLNDILQNPSTLIQAAKIIAEYYRHQEIDAIMTIETQGVGLAAAVARYLNIQYVVVRRDSNETSGPTISVNYISGSHQTVRKMELAKNSLQAHSRVLIIDDFMHNGGTVNGLISLLKEFDCQCIGTCVFAENVLKQNTDLPPYESLFKVEIVYNKEEKGFELKVETGTVLA
ncbi:pur operon repressor [Ignavigranum ruoffiae]|uniref:pur operon repressor n=1 Tax=Ignavigranum ruoffiae TaxID=89093 RepID=UPI0024ADD9E8|nr:pur operon repressor [Ignavigranum ruoffiae]